jgi:hypothetical protein
VGVCFNRQDAEPPEVQVEFQLAHLLLSGVGLYLGGQLSFLSMVIMLECDEFSVEWNLHSTWSIPGSLASVQVLCRCRREPLRAVPLS